MLTPWLTWARCGGYFALWLKLKSDCSATDACSGDLSTMAPSDPLGGRGGRVICHKRSGRTSVHTAATSKSSVSATAVNLENPWNKTPEGSFPPRNKRDWVVWKPRRSSRNSYVGNDGPGSHTPIGPGACILRLMTGVIPEPPLELCSWAWTDNPEHSNSLGSSILDGLWSNWISVTPQCS
jgi:hypothetical protein